MLEKDDTKVEIFGFGEAKDDIFYCLVNLKKSAGGVDLEKLSMANPRKFDEELNKMGCILLLRGDEIEALIKHGEITKADLHKDLYDLARREGMIE